MKQLLISLLCLLSFNIKAQTDTSWSFPIEYCKEPGMLVPTFEDSCMIDGLGFDGPIIKAYLFKFSEVNMVITLKYEKYDVVYVMSDGFIKDMIEIGKNHYYRYPDEELNIDYD